MKHRIVFRLQNRPGYSWYQDLDTGHYSFRQFVFIGDESMHLGGVFQKYFDDKSHPAAFGFLRFVCGGTGHGKDTGAVKDAFKKDDVCDFGQFDFKTRFVISQTSPGNIVPFYYQPTLGGSDIESNLTLRGYPDYRFRGTNLALMQIEYSKPVPAIDPVGILVFYDAGICRHGCRPRRPCGLQPGEALLDSASHNGVRAKFPQRSAVPRS